MKSDLFPGLADIIFAEKAADEIEHEIITLYERLTERTLAKGDPVRLFLETIILIIVQQRSLIITPPNRIYLLMHQVIILII